MSGTFKMAGSKTAEYVNGLVNKELQPVMDLAHDKANQSLRVEELSDFEVEHVLARILGYHSRCPREDGRLPYVMIDDWNKPGTIVEGCRFEPTKDREQYEKLANVLGVKTIPSEAGWTAGVLDHNLNRIIAISVQRGQAIVRCIVKSIYPETVPSEILEDNPL